MTLVEYTEIALTKTDLVEKARRSIIDAFGGIEGFTNMLKKYEDDNNVTLLDTPSVVQIYTDAYMDKDFVILAAEYAGITDEHLADFNTFEEAEEFFDTIDTFVYDEEEHIKTFTEFHYTALGKCILKK